MDWQLLGVQLLIAAAIAYLVRATWKTWFGRTASGCGSGCGKCASSAAPQAAAPSTTGRISLPQV